MYNIHIILLLLYLTFEPHKVRAILVLLKHVRIKVHKQDLYIRMYMYYTYCTCAHAIKHTQQPHEFPKLITIHILLWVSTLCCVCCHSVYYSNSYFIFLDSRNPKLCQFSPCPHKYDRYQETNKAVIYVLYTTGPLNQ